jgi:hypothetical protein
MALGHTGSPAAATTYAIDENDDGRKRRSVRNRFAAFGRRQF